MQHTCICLNSCKAPQEIRNHHPLSKWLYKETPTQIYSPQILVLIPFTSQSTRIKFAKGPKQKHFVVAARVATVVWVDYCIPSLSKDTEAMEPITCCSSWLTTVTGKRETAHLQKGLNTLLSMVREEPYGS